MSKRRAAKPAKAPPLKLIGQEQSPPVPPKNAGLGRMLSRQEVVELVAASYVSIWSWIRQGRFPPGRSLGGPGDKARVAWIEAEVLDWMANLPKRIPKPLSKSA